ncbi:MAG: bifunctional glutamate N-acetyltransferase/amino-acid acetyltransferase ArgJ [Proteobacteria bacterium]|nr:bifunctional glutamate N-acetyltransferase/amino-acid acetyltransferase ArgJ [Pseudomonadota bacterium]
MTISFNQIFGKRSEYRVKDFPELPNIEGLQLAFGNADLYKKKRNDICFFYFQDGASFAGVYTKSAAKSHCITWNKKIKSKKIKGLFVNTKNANTLNGQQGFDSLNEIAYLISRNKNISSKDILFASTGVIGEKFPAIKIKYSLDKLLDSTAQPSRLGWVAAAHTIMTTDTIAKMAFETFTIGGKTVNISGIAKGSGMIFPNMGTLLGFIFTDANIAPSVLNNLLKKKVENTFNAITVDGDTSTNDMVLLFATNKSTNKMITNKDSAEAKVFEKKLEQVMLNLAKQVAIDGEGAKKFITINIKNCKSKSLAKAIGFSIGNSPLVKTAIAAADPNWGRIIMAVGKTNEYINKDKISLKIGGYLIFKDGEISKNYKEHEVKEYMLGDNIVIDVEMGSGKDGFTVYTCDLTQEYVSINADYRS